MMPLIETENHYHSSNIDPFSSGVFAEFDDDQSGVDAASGESDASEDFEVLEHGADYLCRGA